MIFPVHLSPIIREIRDWILGPRTADPPVPDRDEGRAFIPSERSSPSTRPNRDISARRFGRTEDYSKTSYGPAISWGLSPLVGLGATLLLGALGAIFRVRDGDGEDSPEQRETALRNIERQILEAHGFRGSLEELRRIERIETGLEAARTHGIVENVRSQAIRLYQAGEFSDADLGNLSLGENLPPEQALAALARAERYRSLPDFAEYSGAIEALSDWSGRNIELARQMQRGVFGPSKIPQLLEQGRMLAREGRELKERIETIQDRLRNELPSFFPGENPVSNEVIESFLSRFGYSLSAEEFRLVAHFENEERVDLESTPALRVLEIIRYNAAHSSSESLDLSGLTPEQLRAALAHVEAYFTLPAMEEYRATLHARRLGILDPNYPIEDFMRREVDRQEFWRPESPINPAFLMNWVIQNYHSEITSRAAMRLVEQRELASQQTNSAFLSWHFLDLEDHHSTCYLVEDPSSLLAEGEQDSSMRETAGGPRIIPPAPSGERPTRLPERPDSVSLAVPRLQEVLNSRIEGRPPLVLDSREIRQIQHEEINEEVVARQVFELFPADMHTEAYRDYANEIAA